MTDELSSGPSFPAIVLGIRISGELVGCLAKEIVLGKPYVEHGGFR